MSTETSDKNVANKIKRQTENTIKYYKNIDNIEEVPIDILRAMYKDALVEREQDKKKIKELEEENEELLEVKISCSAVNIIENLQKENESKQKAYDNCYCEYKKYKQFESIPKQKVIDRINCCDERIKHAKQIRDKEQEEFYTDLKRAFNKLLEEK